MNTKIAVSTMFAMLLTGFGSVALAQDAGFFVDGYIGNSDASGGGLSDDDTSIGVSVGYDINQNFAVAVGYDDFGSFQGLDADGYNIRVIGTLPLNEKWALFGQVGNQHWDVSGGGAFGGSADGDDLLIGVGGKLKLAKMFSLIGGYNFFEADNVDVDTWYIGGEYKFH